MKKLLLFIAVASLFSACRGRRGSGNIITEKRTVSNFKGVEAGGAFEVELITGPEYKVEVQADDNLMSLIETRVSGDVLKIDTRGNIGDGTMRAIVTAPEFTSIRASGASDVKATTPLKSASKLFVGASGAAQVEAEIDAPTVETDASGASEIELSGRTKEYKAEASGSADIKTQGLKSETAKASASGSASVHVFSSIRLDAHASGAGAVHFSGGGAVNTDKSGAGSIEPE